ncbi:MAG: sugar transferase [Scytonema sp. RU_4_4]|nr:sugar transferase [Scytonema sp. RU_4_4]NJR74925.1 sugar transferase [Scytonema sp. CRU_2_7]
MDGICTLANDQVYDQLVALLNSIEAIYGHKMPVCVYPYDDNTAQIAVEIARRPNVQLYDNQDSIQQWDEFVRSIWDAHPTAQKHWQQIGSNKYHRIGTHRRYCAFDAPFDRFVYMDADTLLMSPLKQIFNRLNQYNWVVYDFQFKDLSHVYNTSSAKLRELFTPEKLQTEIFCSGFYASKKDIFDVQKRSWLLEKLQQTEAEVLYDMAPDQTILNYMVMRSSISSYNFAHQLPENERTGCCVTSPHFEVKNNILYDKGHQLTYIHYIGLSSKLFTRLCSGENIDFPYREIFLHYRYLHEADKRPKFKSTLKAYNEPPSLATRILRKLGLIIHL